MIHVDQLSKYYDDFCAVDRISFEIEKGEVVGLLGPNGAGKTTTLRMLTGYFPPTSGTIRVQDYTISEHPLEIKQMMGYLPESAPLYHGMLVYDYLDYVARIRGFAKAARIGRIQHLADICDIHGIMHKTIDSLSKGLKQRVGLAHAMMDDPEILVLDEPTSGLDPNQIVEIREIIRKIGQEKTVILSTHILSEAEATCDRIIIINKGQIIADDRTAALKQSAGIARRVHLSLVHADAEAMARMLSAVEGVGAVQSTPLPDGRTIDFELDCTEESDPRAAVYETIKQTDAVLLELYQETQSLEAIFRELTREN
jgi:gliding motility-associated transport system ATP-binding protein